MVLSSDDDDLDSLLDSDDEVSLLTSSVFSGKPPQGSPLKGSSGGINVVKGAHRRKKAPARRVPTFPPKQKAATMCFDVELTMFCERVCPPSEDLMFYDNYVQIPVPGQPVLNVKFTDIEKILVRPLRWMALRCHADGQLVLPANRNRKHESLHSLRSFQQIRALAEGRRAR